MTSVTQKKNVLMAAPREGEQIAARVEQAGLEVVRLAHPSGALCVATLQGGHVLSFENCRGEQLLFLSSRAAFAPGKAIRGGVPVVFPQFGPGALPQHGFARTARWALAEGPALVVDDVVAVLSLRDNDATRAVWPHPFELRLRIACGSERLSMELTVSSSSSSSSFTAALHTYLRVDDVRAQGTAVVPTAAGETFAGLEFTTNEPPHNDGSRKTETRSEVAVDRFTDRAYFGAPTSVTLRCAHSSISVVQGGGFRDTVVWNPWDERGARIADLGENEWTRFVCVEAAAIASPVPLSPGRVWSGSQAVARMPAARL